MKRKNSQTSLLGRESNNPKSKTQRGQIRKLKPRAKQGPNCQVITLTVQALLEIH